MTGPLARVLTVIQHVRDETPTDILHSANDLLEELSGEVADQTYGTSRSEPGEIIAAIQDARGQIEIALRECDTADKLLAAYVADIQSGGGAGTTGSSTPPRPSPTTERVDPGTTAPVRTRPSRRPDPGNTPHGTTTPAHPTRERERPLRRENESAKVLARTGYDIEQNPPGRANGKNPDYRIEGQYWDCYAPASDTADQIRNGISKKVKDKRGSSAAVRSRPCTSASTTSPTRR